MKTERGNSAPRAKNNGKQKSHACDKHQYSNEKREKGRKMLEGKAEDEITTQKAGRRQEAS